MFSVSYRILSDWLGLRGKGQALTLGVLAMTASEGCKRSNRTLDASFSMTAHSTDAPHALRRLSIRQQEIRRWAMRCGISVAKENCDVGDAALFNGILCLSGDLLSCEAVRRSQGVDGRMWRSEHRVAADAVNSFSRDMALGVFAYLVATKDRDLASRWMSWIETNEFRLCRESSDNRCDFTPGFWMFFRDVWEFIGLTPNEQMRSAVVEESVMALLQARFSPAGFEMHLAGVNALIRQSMGQSSATLNSMTETLADRQPGNPFFAYLVHGPRSDVIDKTLAWCPSSKPPERHEWSFERDQRSEPWKLSMGWECLMLINLLSRDLKGNIAGR